ncbi:MAG TPA: LapA family protein [Desulfobacteraceae bacterium]|nr:LapA family protein [Desulfobacteraceae bacterium]HPJ66496.1 LapA family protein [Desulfobacteraceae bacterium]HPQ28216.1 LapA family protein [Desulfobacteraceae bacterium]
MNYKIVMILILALFAVLFIIQNVALVEVQFMFWSIQMSRSLLIFLLVAIGIIIGWFFHSFFKRRRK